MATKKKYYVVWDGVKPGIYETWAEAKVNIFGYPNAKYKSYKSIEEAKEAFRGGSNKFLVQSPAKRNKGINTKSNSALRSQIDLSALSVDAACSGNPGLMEYRAVWIKDGVEQFRQGPFKMGTNNIGEFLAIVHALALFKKKNMNTPIYTDSRTAMAWVRKKKANTKLEQTYQNEIIFDLINRAENWLKTNTYENQLLKWNTKELGEIPADFGRK